MFAAVINYFSWLGVAYFKYKEKSLVFHLVKCIVITLTNCIYRNICSDIDYPTGYHSLEDWHIDLIITGRVNVCPKDWCTWRIQLKTWKHHKILCVQHIEREERNVERQRQDIMNTLQAFHNKNKITLIYMDNILKHIF